MDQFDTIVMRSDQRFPVLQTTKEDGKGPYFCAGDRQKKSP